MPTIPKFAVALAKLAKSNPKIIPSSPTSKKRINMQPKKFTKDDIELAKIRKEKIRKSINQSLSKKSKDDLCDTVDILKMNPNYKLSGYKPGEKIKIYNKNNMNEFIEIICPDNPTFSNIVENIRKVNRGEEYV